MIDHSDEIRRTYRVLVRGIKWNMNYRDLNGAYNIEWEVLWSLLNTDDAGQIDERWRPL